MDRRAFIAAATALPVAGYAATAKSATTTADQIQHHAAEIQRLLRETAPEGMAKVVDVFILNDGRLTSTAFPAGYARGDTYAVFCNGKWSATVSG